MSEGTYLSEDFPFGEDVEKEGDNHYKRDRRRGTMKQHKRYLCPECNKMLSKQEGCVCDDCGAILLADANREMFGDEAEWMEVTGMTDFGDK